MAIRCEDSKEDIPQRTAGGGQREEDSREDDNREEDS
jgi:hypothetical protein